MRKKDKRKKRHRRIRKKVIGTSQKPRLCVFRSNLHFYAQMVNDIENKVLFGISTLSGEFKKRHKVGGNIEAAKILGKLFAEEARKKEVKKCVFDRGGYLYHGRVKAFAESAREAGLEF